MIQSKVFLRIFIFLFVITYSVDSVKAEWHKKEALPTHLKRDHFVSEASDAKITNRAQKDRSSESILTTSKDEKASFNTKSHGRAKQGRMSDSVLTAPKKKSATRKNSISLSSLSQKDVQSSVVNRGPERTADQAKIFKNKVLEWSKNEMDDSFIVTGKSCANGLGNVYER